MRARLLTDSIDETCRIASYGFPQQRQIPGISTASSLKLQVDIEFPGVDVVGSITFAMTAREAIALAERMLSYCGDSKRRYER